MEQKEQEPFDREAWRKLLGAETGAPTKEMDLRILAEARRAITPRVGLWWLPASLAASLLLAVLIVQSQLADFRKPAAVTEADVPATPAADAIEDSGVRYDLAAPPQQQEDSAGAIAAVPLPEVQVPAMEEQREPAQAPAAATAPAPPPAVESPTSADSAAREGALLRNQTMDAESAAPAERPADAAPERERAEEKGAAMQGVLKANESYAESRTPEQWYKDIAALRAAGHIEEADAELVRFKSRYPDWLEQHHQTDP